MKKGIIALLVVALAGGAGAAGYYYYKGGQLPGTAERVSSDSEDAIYVDSVAILAGLGSGNGVIQRYAGVIEPQQTWEVKLENERSVEECYVKEGDEVKEGQKLFTYDTTDDEDKLAQAEIDLERCENDIETATSRKAQLEKEKKSASSDDQLSYTTQILSEETTIKMSEYEYKSKQLEIEQLKEKISDATVYSEISGIIKSINDPNSSSSSSYMSDSTSDAAYITVLQVGDYRVKGTVNEQNIGQISEGMEMIVHSRVDESLTWHGIITEINRDKGETNTESSYYYSSSDSGNSSTNYPYYVELDASDGLMLGQHVYMEPDLGQEDQKDGIWLDDYYFEIGEDGSAYVWAASTSNHLEKRAVTLGEYDEELAAYEVLEGLGEDDYITVPYEELTEGLPVIYNEYSLDSDYSMDGSDYDMYMDDEWYDDGEYYDEEYADGEDYVEGIDDEWYDDSVEYDDMGDYYDADEEDGVVYEEDEEALAGLSDDAIYEEE